jgi:uncharacterized protein (TIGR02145 family)
MAGETFELRFRNNEDTYLSIDEPINFATVDFQLKQKDKGYGRDVSFNGGEVQFEFVKYRNHYLDKLLLYNNTYGFEAIVELIITTVVSPPTIIGELDFATAITDDFEYFKCKVIQQSSKQIVKRRKSVKVDLLSDKDIDGNYISPLVPQNMIMKAKPITQNSRWKSEGMGYTNVVDTGNEIKTRYVNYCSELYDSSIPTSYAPSNTGDADGTRIITATDQINGITVTISNHTTDILLENTKNWLGSGGSGSIDHYYAYSYGANFGDNQVILPDTTIYLEYRGQTASYTKSFTFTINSLSAGHSIWLYHRCSLDHDGAGYSTFKIKQTKMDIEIVASVTSVDSLVFSFRLIDVMRQVVKSTSGLDIYAPRFDVGGGFYDNRLVNGNFLRQITETIEMIDNGQSIVPTIVKKPFSISLEDLEKSLVELNVDWEISEYLVDDVRIPKIFFGTEDDFYTEYEIKVFPDVQFSSFNKTFNPRFQINEFNYGYKKFQSQKENEIINSYDVINGESRWVLQNKSVENKKDISIEWVRDSFLIEESRRKAIELTTATSSQDDDTLFIVDARDTVATSSVSQNKSFLNYYNAEEHLQLTSLDTNLTTLPFLVGDKFNITSDPNAGNYFIISKSTSILTLERITDVVTNTTPSSTTYSWSSIDNLGNPTSGTQSLSAIHTFVSTGVSPSGNRTLTLTNSTTYPITHQIEDLISITTNKNKGQYRITFVGTTFIRLKRLSDASIPTTPIPVDFNYGVNPAQNPFTSYTNEWFALASNIIQADKFANLRYSIKRNIHNYWRKYLSTCNLYKREFPIKNTWYKNNKYFLSEYNSIKLEEGSNISTAFTDSKPNLTPFIYNDVIFANVEFSDFIALQNSLRTTRGYIKTYDNNGLPILLYPMTMKYENLSKELIIKAEEKFNSSFTPTIETKSVSPKSGTTQLSGGTFLSDGYSAITSKGVVWNTSANPTVALSTKTNDGTGYGSFTSLMSPLIQFTNYYAKSYATNAKGTSYGQETSFLGGVTDVQIGNQIWMVENLDVVKYRNGDTIPQVTDPSAWAGLTTGAWCWYANSSANGLVYGKLYNWYAVNDSRGLAPLGYYIPTDTEFEVLTSRLGGVDIAGGQMKATTLWNSPNTGATNKSGFTALPTGYRFVGDFIGIGDSGGFWISTENNTTNAFNRNLYYNDDNIVIGNSSKTSGLSVRLLKEYVVIGTQKWTNRNLNVSTYRNGVTIPQVTDPTAWAGLTTGAWCYYNNDPTTEATYGKLYNWYAVNDSRGLAPLGYHVPSDTEWTTLTTYLGGEAVAGGKMKETGTSHWTDPNVGATNESAFTGIPAGVRYDYGEFSNFGYYGNWWSSLGNGTENAWFRRLRYDNVNVDRASNTKNAGFSVRLIKD